MYAVRAKEPILILIRNVQHLAKTSGTFIINQLESEYFN